MNPLAVHIISRSGHLCPLDAFPILPGVALSTRRLRSVYAGACLQVRRSTNGDIADIGFDGQSLDVPGLLAFCAGGDGFVRGWYDQSPRSLHAWQTLPANQPKVVVSGAFLGGLVFDGKVSSIATDNTDITITTPLTICAAYQSFTFPSASSLPSLWRLGPNVGARLWAMFMPGTRNLAQRIPATNAPASPEQLVPATGGAILTWQKTATANQSAITSRVNGGPPSSYPAQAISSLYKPYISIAAGFGQAFVLHEFLFFSGVSMADESRQAIERSQAAHFGLPLVA